MNDLAFSISTFCINQKDYVITRHSCRVEAVDLFQEISSTPLFPKVYWSHRDRDEKCIAFGSLLQTEQIPTIKKLQTLEGLPFDPRFYGGVPFPKDPKKKPLFESFDTPFFFLPQYELVENSGTFTLYSSQLFQQIPESVSPSFPKLSFKNLDSSASLEPLNFDHDPNFSSWQQTVDALLEKIKQGSFEKVVLARQSQAKLQEPLNPYLLLKKLKSSFSNSSLFCFQKKASSAFLGATPECLYTRNKFHISTEAVAGTANMQKKESLLKSTKELHEFQYVTNFISQRLGELCSKIDKGEPKILHVGYLKHLYNAFNGDLLKTTNDQEIINKLFPSPALCGTPCKEALSALQQAESFNRHWYASPVGWISEEHAEFIIAIRSCIVQEQNIHLFVGNGIVSGSNPQHEWEELNTKISPFLKLFQAKDLKVSPIELLKPAPILYY